MKSLIKKYTSLLLAGIMAFSILFSVDFTAMNAKAYWYPNWLAIEKSFGSFNLNDYIECNRSMDDSYDTNRFKALKATYSVENPSVATVDSKGIVTLKSVGSTDITITINGESRDAHLYVIKDTTSFAEKKALNDKVIAANSKYKKITAKNRLACLNEINAILQKGKELDAKTVYANDWYPGSHAYNLTFPRCLDDPSSCRQDCTITYSYENWDGTYSTYDYVANEELIMVPAMRQFDDLVRRLSDYQNSLSRPYVKKVTAKGKTITTTFSRKLNESDIFATLVPEAGKKYSKVPASYKVIDTVRAYCNKKTYNTYTYATTKYTVKKGIKTIKATASKKLKKGTTYLVYTLGYYGFAVKAK